MYKSSVKKLSLLTFALATLTSFGFVSIATAIPVTATSSASTSSTTTTSTADQAKIKIIITKGNAEITRRLTTLGTLSSKISAATKLTSSDKSGLAAEVSGETTALTSLKTKLDADTDLTTAKSDAESIFTEYRVYALVVPQVALVKTADDQQVVETKLTSLAAKLQTRVTASKNATSLQTTLNDLNAKVTAAQAISSSIESKVVGLQPSDYDSDHTILSGDAAQLKTAQTDNQSAITDAKIITSGL